MINHEMQHTIKRFKERYNIDLTERDYNRLLERIKKGKGAKFVQQSIHYKEIWVVNFQGKKYEVVFNPITGYISTVIPPMFTDTNRFNNPFDKLL